MQERGGRACIDDERDARERHGPEYEGQRSEGDDPCDLRARKARRRVQAQADRTSGQRRYTQVMADGVGNE